MKVTTTCLLLFSSLFLFSQKSKSEAIDIFLKETQVKKSSEDIMAVVIKQQMSRKPNAPKTIEQEIQKLLDYEGYMQKVKDAYNSTYSEKEIVELIKIFRSRNKYLLKEKTERVSKKLYEIGNNFGKESLKVITSKLSPY